MGNNLTTFQYKENDIAFQNDENVMVNATEMAKIFGKRVSNWLRLDSTTEFMQALNNQRGSHMSNGDNQLVIKKQGGDQTLGTWMHEDVAIEFSR